MKLQRFADLRHLPQTVVDISSDEVDHTDLDAERFRLQRSLLVSFLVLPPRHASLSKTAADLCGLQGLEEGTQNAGKASLAMPMEKQ